MKLIFITFFLATIIVESYGLLGEVGGPVEGVAGGIQPAKDSESYTEIKKLTADGVCETENDTCYKLVKINNATKQVVAGIKYTVTGIFKTTDPKAYYILTVSIWSQPWNNFVQSKILSFYLFIYFIIKSIFYRNHY